jgi:hypothetical protein
MMTITMLALLTTAFIATVWMSPKPCRACGTSQWHTCGCGSRSCARTAGNRDSVEATLG